MADQDLFEEEENNKPSDEPTKPTEEEKTGETPSGDDDLLKTITNEDGTPKYKTREDFIKGAANAQEHIKTLESELATLRAQGNPTEKLEELLEAVKSGGGKGEEASAMKPDDILNIVKDYFADVKAAETRENNITSVTSVFKNRYGKDASEKLYGKAADLGFSKSEINRMIATNPKAAMRVLGEDMPKAKPNDPVGGTGAVDTGHFRQTPPTTPKSVMGHTSQKVLQDAWEDSKRRTLERLGIKLDN